MDVTRYNIILLALQLYELVTGSRFFKVSETNAGIESVIVVKGHSLIFCAQQCMSLGCDSYTYHRQLNQCQYGNCNVTKTLRDENQRLYVSCNESSGFKLLTSGAAKACVWASNTTVVYNTAKADCTARNAHLYTVKSLEKLWILQNNFLSAAYWVGLDCMQLLGSFKWVDDNTECNTTWQRSVFETGEPNNYLGLERCVNYNWDVPYLNDDRCSKTLHYICEKPCFNFY